LRPDSKSGLMTLEPSLVAVATVSLLVRWNPMGGARRLKKSSGQ
jgi:hypothetical protein